MDLCEKNNLTYKQWVKLQRGGWASLWLPVEIQNRMSGLTLHKLQMGKQRTRLEFKDYFLTEEERKVSGVKNLKFESDLRCMPQPKCLLKKVSASSDENI